MSRVTILAGLIAAAAGPAVACAVPTQLELLNATGQPVQRLAIVEERGGFGAPPSANILAPTGLAPGGRLTVAMPSCIGVYAVTATLADGTQRHYPGLDAQRIRALELR